MNEEAFDNEWLERDDDWFDYSTVLSDRRAAAVDKATESGDETTGEEEEEEATEEEAYKYGHVCAICLLPWTQRTYLIDCMHSFCFDCIVPWLKQQKTCPLCKQPPRSVAFFAASKESVMNNEVDTTTERPLIQYTIDELEPPPCLPGEHGQDEIIITYVIQVLLDGGTSTTATTTTSANSSIEHDAAIFLREVITFLQSGRDMKTFDNTVSYKMTRCQLTSGDRH
ncbi:hypothetical protein BDF22DRAFT_676796 [Syncephalis plumigaleata]|nr:hypothetical protein BDF22DRAFT_676796 [Syncephalis plumigaleata]